MYTKDWSKPILYKTTWQNSKASYLERALQIVWHKTDDFSVIGMFFMIHNIICLAKTHLRLQIVILCLTGAPLLVLTGNVFVPNFRVACNTYFSEDLKF